MKMSRVLTAVVNAPLWILAVRRFALSPLASHVGSAAAARVLELGCGVGGTTRTLREWFPASRIVATDVDAAQIARARRTRRDPAIRYEVADAQRLPYDDAAFDVVAEFDAFHHLEDWRRAVAEASRVLVPGGAFIVVDVTGALLRRPLVQLLDRPSSSFTAEEFTAAAEARGFTCVADRSRGWLIRHAYVKRATEDRGR